MNSTTTLYDNSTLSDENVGSMNHTGFANNLNFTDIILNPFLYGSSIIFIILIACIITFIFILKSKKKFLFSTNQT